MSAAGTRYLLGIDAGTSVTKAAIFDLEGREIAAAAHPTTVMTPRAGWSEADMNAVWRTTCAAVRDALNSSRLQPAQIAAVGVTGNMVGAWLIDDGGRPVRSAILWNDGRTQGWIDQRQAADSQFLSAIFQSSGSVMQPGCTLPLLRWLADHEPETLTRARAVLNCKGWIIYRLTGAIVNDITEASVAPGDNRARTYSEAMIDLIDVRAYRHLLPPVFESHAVIGHLTPEAAVETGLAAGTPVIAGAGDVPAAVLGAGAVEAGVAVTILGTTCLNGLVTAAPLFEPADVGLLFALPGAGWLRTMVNIAGTTNLDWMLRQFFAERLERGETPETLFAAAEALAQTSPPGATGVTYLPYLSAVGIIAPVVAPHARAGFHGLHDGHTRADLVRAVYEGLALSIRDCYAVMPAPVSEIRLTGGAARSTFLCQLIADSLNARVIVPEGSEFGARGAALLAAVGVGAYASVQQAVRGMVSGGTARTYLPDAARTAAYAESYVRYCAIREKIV